MLPERLQETLLLSQFTGNGDTRLITAAVESPRTSRSGFGRSALNNWAIAGKGVRPDDNLRESDPDLDLVELFYEIEDECGIKISDEATKKMDGTFDAIVRYVASQRGSTS